MQTEAGFDFCSVEVSSDNGGSWQNVASFSGTLSTWTQQTYDITSYANGSSQVKVRFRLTSDAGVVGDGWYVDDVALTSYCGTLTGISHNNGGVPMVFALSRIIRIHSIRLQVLNTRFRSRQLFQLKCLIFLDVRLQTLVNEKKDAGYYNVNFDASNYASGMYFYKIEAGEFVETKKMVLVK